jgi:hypothetical protein
MVGSGAITTKDNVAQILVGVGQRCLDDVEAETRDGFPGRRAGTTSVIRFACRCALSGPTLSDRSLAEG